MYFGRKIKEYREKVGLTVEQAAKKLNVSKEKILDWEKGNILPTEEEIQEISSTYEIFEGSYPVYVFYEYTKKYVSTGFVDVNEPMLIELRDLLGEENVVVR